MHHLKAIFQKFQSLKTRRPRLTIGLAFVIFFILGGALFTPFGQNLEEMPPAESYRSVELQSVQALSGAENALSLVGTVRSESEATVLAETSGRVLYVNHELGDYVTAGSVIAEIENSGERAALASAQAALLRAEASLSRESRDVRLDALNTYRTVYTLASDAIYNKTDSLFDAARTSAPQLNINPFGETELETERALINDILLDWSLSVESATRDSNSRVLLEEAYEDVSAIKSFLDRLSVIVNRQTTSGARAQTTIDAEKAAVLSARSNVDSALASIASAQDSLEENLEADSGGTGESDAALASARADVSSAQAALSKTVIRAPISGTINMLAIERGNTVSASEPAVRIANNQALEVRTYISSEERDFIHVGMPVTLEGSIEAVVTKIAPALDPQTKKIEVRIGVADSAAELVNGASVRLSLIANGGATDADGALSIPLSAIKLSGTEPRVFSVSSENTLVAHTVELGDVRGSAVEIHGIDPSLFIVTDARGLKAGERVTVLE